MGAIPSIDLHPDRVPGGAHAAVRAARDFLERSLAAGAREVRLITGVGLRGDGTPRLRGRVESEVLASFHADIEHSVYEQGGAVIRLSLRARPARPAAAWVRHQRRQDERSAVADREERLGVAWDRLDQAGEALDEGDLRRCRLKLNQVAREFGFEMAPPVLDATLASRLLADHERRLEALDR